MLKKLPGLLVLCGFALIPALVAPSFLLGRAPERTVSLAQDTPIVQEVTPPAPPPPQPKEVVFVTVTAYSSTPDQTDNTPFHTANGKAVGEGIVAANFLSLGTQLRIPEVFGDKIFTVQDRMHERFERRIDIWMPSRKEAKLFGIRDLMVEVLSEER